MALYDDVSGAPGNLVASSNIATVGDDIVSFPVSPTQLTAGDYWIMAIYDADGGHTYSKEANENVVYYQPLDFDNEIPSNGSEFVNYTGTDFTYFAEITCGTMGISDFSDLDSFSLYPNPVSDLVTINGDEKLIGATYTIIDLLGNTVLTGKFYNKTFSIDISHLNTGVYLFQIGQHKKQTLKLIKK